MRRFAPSASSLATLALFCGAACAQDFSAEVYAAKLKTYDSGAVEAARDYAATLDLRALLTKSAPFLAQGARQRVTQANPALSDEQTQAFLDQFIHAVLSQDVDTLDHAAVLTLLETLDKDELQALVAFQRTPLGGKVVRKMPLLAARLNENMRLVKDFVAPRAMRAAREEMLKAGVEVRI
jgi:hypothetical protein